VIVATGLALGSAAAPAGDADLERLFARAGVTGTLVLSALDGATTYVHDDARANRRFPAASTFKIPNTLISLQEGVATADMTFRWDGRVRDVAELNRDQTLDSAFRTSCVWCYQQLASQVGAARYRRYIASLDYGHLAEPFGVTTFWLDGSLTVSAAEQVAFLRRVKGRAFPFRPTSYDALERIMTVEERPGLILRAKTGWATSVSPAIGWYVGWVEGGRGAWLFALNLDVRGKDDLPLRESVVRQALQLKGLMPK